MKWKNKGHELDGLGQTVTNINNIYLFGAGEHGKAVFERYANKINICGFIDNDAEKINTLFCNKQVYSLTDISLRRNEAIVITTQPSFVPMIKKQLAEKGYLEGSNVFAMQVFFPVYDMYKYEEICLSSISFLPTTVCNLKCKQCLNFAPYIANQSFRPIEGLKRDIDFLFSKIDTLLLLHLSGGEPLLYPYLNQLIAHISEKYSHNIGRLELTTNGTVVPSDDVCEIMAKSKIQIIVDDYRDAVPQHRANFDKLIEKLSQFAIPYKILKADYWIDLAPFTTDNSHLNESDLCQYFDNCAVPWQEYRDGKLWLCNYASYADVADIHCAQENEYFALNKLNDSNKRELIEFRLGYSEKGYVDFCKRCRSYGNNNTITKVAEQM